jgi:hypothetical protein
VASFSTGHASQSSGRQRVVEALEVAQGDPRKRIAKMRQERMALRS